MQFRAKALGGIYDASVLGVLRLPLSRKAPSEVAQDDKRFEGHSRQKSK
jgi:hypothetical protein